MKEIVDTLYRNRVILRDLEQINLREELNSRKRIDIYLGKNFQNSSVVVVSISKKSRVLQKEVKEIMDLISKLEFNREIQIKRRYIYLKAPICSKADSILKGKKWKFLNL